MTRRKVPLCILFVALTISISLFTITSSNVAAKEQQTTLSYGEYFSLKSRNILDPADYIDWSFNGSAPSVGIEVWTFDTNNYSVFQSNPSAAFGYQQSNGSFSADAGNWSVASEGKWHIVFYHNQTAGSSTDLTIIVEFVNTDRSGLWYGLGIGIVSLIVISIFVFTQIRQSQEKRKVDTSSHISPSSFDSDSKTKMMSRLDKRESQKRRDRILEGGTLPELSELVVYYPTKNEKIDSDEVDVRGKTAIKSIVWINDQASFVDVDGSFIGSIKLFKGRNSIDIVAIGPYGKHLGTKIPVTCTSKSARSSSSVDGNYILPERSLDIRHDEMPLSSTQTTEAKSAASRKRRGKTDIDDSLMTSPIPSPDDPIVVSEEEIDPSVLAALKGDPITEEEVVVDSVVPLDDIEPEPVLTAEISEDEIPPIPDITGPEEDAEPQLPEIPSDIVKEDEELDETVVIEDDEDLEESMKLLEKVVDSGDEVDGEFQPDKMIPKQPAEGAEEEASFEDQLEEFQPLKQDVPGTQELIVETTKQELDDERKTIILLFNGMYRNDKGELVQYIKLEKRLECVLEKWYSTIGIANISKEDLQHVEIQEFVSDTVEFTGKLPSNVEEPIIDKMDTGVKITWYINSVKADAKLFLTYNEKVNPLELLPEEHITPKIIIRK